MFYENFPSFKTSKQNKKTTFFDFTLRVVNTKNKTRKYWKHVQLNQKRRKELKWIFSIFRNRNDDKNFVQFFN